MESFNINLATYDYHGKRLLFRLIVSFAGVIFILTLINLKLYLDNLSTINDYEQNIQVLQTEISKKERQWKEKYPKLNQNEKFILEKQLKTAMDVLLKDVFPWPRLLDSVEMAIPEGVIIERMAFSGNIGEFLIRGYAESIQDIERCLQSLNSAPTFRENILSILSIGPGDKEAKKKFSNYQIGFEILSKLNTQELLKGAKIEDSKGR